MNAGAATPREILDLAVDQLDEKPQDGKGPAGPLARKLGLDYNRVYRWLQPGNGPDADGLLVILETFGWLQLQGRQGELEARVAELESALAHLGPDLAALASLPERVLALERQAPPKKARAR